MNEEDFGQLILSANNKAVQPYRTDNAVENGLARMLATNLRYANDRGMGIDANVDLGPVNVGTKMGFDFGGRNPRLDGLYAKMKTGNHSLDLDYKPVHGKMGQRHIGAQYKYRF